MRASLLRKLRHVSDAAVRPTRVTDGRCFTTVSPTPALADSELYMWGTNTKGSLPGMDKVVDVPAPVQWRDVLGISDPNVWLKQIKCGPTDTAFVLSDGQCFVCGENKAGQLGLGHKDPVETPTQLGAFENGVMSIALGSTSTAVIDTKGELYTFGFGGGFTSGLGQLGHGDGDTYLRPKLVESFVEDGCFAQQVHVGDSHMAVLTTEGEVLTAGCGAYGRLGNFSTIDQLYFEPVELLVMDVVQIAGGRSFTLALTKDGVVHSWGRNHKGQLGTGLGMSVDMYAMSDSPTPITGDELAGRRVTKVSAGASHAAAVTDGGELFYWGMSLHFEPVRVTTLLHTKIVDVFCGKDYTIAQDREGNLYSFGNGKTGVLGQASVKKLNQPALVEALADKRVVSVSAGWSHVACEVAME